MEGRRSTLTYTKSSLIWLAWTTVVEMGAQLQRESDRALVAPHDLHRHYNYQRSI